MSTEGTLVQLYTEIFKTLGELQRVADELEAYFKGERNE